ncbi:MAG: hypothetical protein KF690_02120 [Bacteroidetes bacterium]|nr:hypothetical protein [Bacteroidota bacterium]
MTLRYPPFLFRVTAGILLVSLLLQVAFPIAAYALTGGSAAGSVQGDVPSGTTDMVDVFTGDFSYRIPLLDVDGYPLVLSYNAGIGTEQEAGWVGLGWSLSPGGINRMVRGMPDDFAGDPVHREFNVRDQVEIGGTARIKAELAGEDLARFLKNMPENLDVRAGATASLTVKHRTNLGIDVSIAAGIGAQFQPTLNSSSKLMSAVNVSGQAYMGYALSAQDGISANTSLSGSLGLYKRVGAGLDLGGEVGYSSRRGLAHIGFHAAGVGGLNLKALNLRGKRGISGMIPLATPTYVPDNEYPFNTIIETYSGDAGGAVIFSYLGGGITYFRTVNTLATHEMELRGYGYMALQQGNPAGRSLLDINREYDAPVMEKTPILPLANLTYDVYSVSGQGVGGVYRPFRSDIGTLYDPRIENGSRSSASGLELGFPGSTASFKVGADLENIWVDSHTGAWLANDGNPAAGNYRFSAPAAEDPAYEPFYFRQVDEAAITLLDNTPLANAGGEDLVAIRVEPGLSEPFMQKAAGGTVTYTQPDAALQGRERRTQPMTFLPASKGHYALDKDLHNYDLNTFAFQDNLLAQSSTNPSFPRADDTLRKGHHISEVTVLRADGVRYVYGIPVYVRNQVEATFDIDSSASQGALVGYTETENSTGNSAGETHFYDKTILPPHATGYLLTGVVSPDYQDLKGDGMTEDDLGNYTRFNYTRTTDAYKFRAPYSDAVFNQGLYANNKDQKASFMYGEKEDWYVHSIESKNYIAVFYLSERQDAIGASAENQSSDAAGRSQGARSYRLDKIRLYARKDLKENAGSAVPLKTVHFEYTYELCPGTPNSAAAGGGKLTLKRLFFTYDLSEKAVMNTYEFHYANNPAYGHLAHDAWGYYKAADANQQYFGAPFSLNNAEFPYVIQDKTLADQYSSAWCLNKIDLPTGGSIEITYESDDYAYVQNERASVMQVLEGVSKEPNETGGGNDMPASAFGDASSLYFHFKVRNAQVAGALATSGSPALLIRDRYLSAGQGRVVRSLFHNTAIYLAKNEYLERLKNYVDINPLAAETYVYGGERYVVIPAPYVSLKDRNGLLSQQVSPLTKSAWNFAVLNIPRAVYPAMRTDDSSTVEEIAWRLLGMLEEIMGLFVGRNAVFLKKGYGVRVEAKRSFIRLVEPGGRKLGGGCRVKQLLVKDNWDTMSASAGTEERASSYGQTYTYEMDGGDGWGMISSGVAQYEPMTAADEITLHRPEAFTEELKLAPNNSHFKEVPVGESFFPAPVVGYRKVIVRDYDADALADAARTGKAYLATRTGRVEYEFYTAKDFPVFTDRTPIYGNPSYTVTSAVSGVEDNAPNSSLTRTVRQGKEHNALTLSQGFVIELNDMHGKLRSQTVYDQDNHMVSSVAYDYKLQGGVYNPHGDNKLLNRVKVVDPKGCISEAYKGLTVEVYHDARRGHTSTSRAATNFNAGADFSTSIPMPWLNIKDGRVFFSQSFSLLTTTKVISRKGVLERVTAVQDGSRVATENRLWDSETGDVLLTRVQNEFDDWVYALTFPAHWAYEGMGPAYKNVGADLFSATGEEISNGWLNISNADKYFVPGDELILNTEIGGITGAFATFSNGTPHTVVEVNEFLSGTWKLRYHTLSQGIKVSTLVFHPGKKFSRTNCPSLRKRLYEEVLFEGCVEAIEYMVQDPCDIYDTDTTSLAESVDNGANFMYPGFMTTFPYVFPDTLPPVSLCLNSTDELCNPYTLIVGCNNCNENNCDCSPECATYKDNNGYVQTGLVASRDSRVWVLEVRPDKVRLMDKQGHLIEVLAQSDQIRHGLTVLRSGRRNLPGLPVGKVSILQEDPVQGHLLGIDPDKVLNAAAIEFTDSWQIFCCGTAGEDNPDCVNPCDKVNPYFRNLRGNWRQWRDYTYMGQRKQTTPADIRHDGTFVSYVPFWAFGQQCIAAGFAATYTEPWKLNAQSTRINPYGAELENRDALDRYAAVLYSFNNTLPVAVATNSRYRQLMYEGFEEFLYDDKQGDCVLRPHFDFQNRIQPEQQFFPGFAEIPGDETPSGVYISTRKAHTGEASLLIFNSAEGAVAAREVGKCDALHASKGNVRPKNQMAECEDCLGLFAVKPKEEFVIQAWTSEEKYASPAGNIFYPDQFSAFIEVSFVDHNGLLRYTRKFRPSGHIIDGWQRIEGAFTVPDDPAIRAVYFKLGGDNLVTDSANPRYGIYFDDLRIAPYDAGVKSFVYEPNTLRLKAELDNRNYAVFYDYDEEGMVVRVRRETERGIFTVQESRNNLFKRD